MLRRSEVISDACAPIVARITLASEVDDALIAAWAQLARAASEPNAFAEHWFVIAALSHLRENRDVRLMQVWEGTTRLIGIIPLTHYNRYGRMPARHVGNWTHYQSFMGTPLIERGYEGQFWHALITALDDSAWASGFLSLTGLSEGGPAHQSLISSAAALNRPVPTVHRFERALLASKSDAETYLSANIRSKKRKELRRLANRLGELGTLRFNVLDDAAELPKWCDDFLSLEAAGWKGNGGAALANHTATTEFLRACLGGAHAAARLDFQRLDLDGRAIAMLINFSTPPGSWSFKIAYDESLARFSPGVLIELENLPRVLGDPEIDWMDSCAVADHPMINSLWGERRAIIQVSLPLAGTKRAALYHACRAAETASARLRSFRSKP
jgi:CelD/BcsL family acetyltransferase involved in cellulose biosynthesis